MFDVLEDEISHYSNLGEILVGGDLNARVGTLPDYITDDTPIDSQTLPVNYDFDHPLPRANMDEGPVNVFGKNLIDLCINSKVRILNGRTPGDMFGKPTCHQPKGFSLVDYVLGSENILLRKTTFFHVHELTPYSDHCKLSLILQSNSKPPLKKETSLPSRPHYKFIWDNDSKEKFSDTLNSSEFTSSISLFMTKNYEKTPQSLDMALNDFVNPLQKAGQKCLSLRCSKKQRGKCKNQQDRKKWFNKTCASARRELHNLAKLLSNNPRDPFIRGSYFVKKKQYTRLIRKTKKDYKDGIFKQLSSFSSDKPAAFWTLLKNYKSNDKTSTQGTIPDESLHSHFKSLYGENARLNAPEPPSTSGFETHIKGKLLELEDAIVNNDLDLPIQRNEIKLAISNLKNGKASGRDLVLNEMLKCSPHILIEPLTKLFNLFLSSGYFPQEWCNSHIVALHKGGAKDDPNNYRGISVTSCLAKLFTSILNSRLTNFLDENKLISPNQAGFRSKFRTSDNLFIIDTLLSKYLTDNKRLYSCFVDFKKAFDSVWREGLRYKLLESGSSGR